MSNKCINIPDAPNGNMSKLFTDILAMTGDREMTKRIWAATRLPIFQEEFGDMEKDENGELTYNAVSQIFQLDNILSETEKDRSLAMDSGLIDKNGNAAEFDVANEALEKANQYNDKAKKLVAVVTKTDDDKYATVVMEKTPLSIANADENKARGELNKALINLLRRIGFDVEFVDDPGYAGIFDPTMAKENAALIKTIIRVANGEEGFEALPEEAVHLLLAGIKNNPIRTRIDNLFTDDVVRRVLGEDYKKYQKKYKKGKTPLSERLRDEAEGKVLAAILKGEKPNITEPETLNIEQNEYTDEFRRIQEESRRLLPEEISEFHSGVLPEEYRDDLKRRLGAVYERLLSRRITGSVGSWSLTSRKNNTTFNILRVNGSLFHDIFEANRNYLENGELVDLHDDYENCKCFLSDNGLCGFAIEPDGNLVSVFSMNPSDKRGFLYAISDFVKQQGATHLDAYASKRQNLQKIYERTLGFKITGRMAFDPSYDENDIIGTKHGNPDVVFMSSTNRDVKEKNFTDYDQAQQNARKHANRRTVGDWFESAKRLFSRLWAYAKDMFSNIAEQDVDAAITNAENALRPVADMIKSGEIEPIIDKQSILDHEPLYDLNARTEKLLEMAEDGEALLSKKLYILQHTKTDADTKQLRGAILSVRKDIQNEKYKQSILSTLAMIGVELTDLGRQVSNLGFVYNNSKDLSLISSESALVRRVAESVDAYKEYLGAIEDLPYLVERNQVELSEQDAKALADMASQYSTQLRLFQRDLGQMRYHVLKQLIMLYYGDMGEAPLGFREAEDAKWASVDSILHRASKDISAWDTTLFSAGDSTNPLINVLHKIIVSQQAKRNNKINKLCMQMQEAHAKLTKAGYDDKFVYQLDENGKPTGYYVGEVDMYKFEQARLAMSVQLDQVEDMDYYERKNLINEWEKIHTSEAEIQLEDGRTYSEMMPSDIYATPNFRDGWSQEQNDYYDALISMKMEMDSYLPYSSRSVLTAPQVRKSVTQMFDKDGRGALKTILSNWKAKYSIVADNMDYGNTIEGIPDPRRPKEQKILLDFAGNPIKRVPVYFTHMLDNREDLSTDATHAMFAYIAMAINVSEMNKLADAMELLRAHVNSEDYEVAQMRGVRKLKDFFSTLGTKYARDYTVSNGRSRIAKEIGRYIDRLVYNETKNELGTMLVGNKEISKDSMFNIFMRLTSISRMGLNPLSGITNATQGETQMIAEAFAKRYFTMGDLGWAKKEYAKLLFNYMGEFNSANRHDKMYLLINQFNSSEDFFRDMTDMDFNKSAFKRVLGRGNIYFLNTMGEHYLHTAGMLAILKHEKVKMLSGPKKGMTISLYDAIKPIHDEKGWHLELSGDLEFADKNKSFLQSFHFGDNPAIINKDENKDELFENLALYINKINADMHGGYSEAEKGNENQTAFWRMILQFRQWMFGMYNKMYSGSYYDAVLNVQREGGYKSIWKFISGTIADMKSLTLKEAFEKNQLTDAEKENARVALAQAGMFVLMCIMNAMTAGWKDEDDRAKRLLAYQIKRLRLETGAIVPNPATFIQNIFSLIQSPAAGINTLKTLSELFILSNYWEEVSSGRYKGWTKAAKAAYSLTPFYNVQKLIDMEDYNYMFNIFR